MEFLLGGLSAVGAVVITNPMDVVKTRFQLQGELRARGEYKVYYRNVFQSALVVLKNDGITGLQKGLIPASLMQFTRNGLRLGIYQAASNKGITTNEAGNTILYKSVLVSVFSGVVGAFCTSPLFLVKTQLQTQSANSIAVGFQHSHKNTRNAISKIYKTFGIAGLWRGAVANMLMAVVGTPSQLTSFAMAKDHLKTFTAFNNSPIFSIFAASVIASIVHVMNMTPFELVSTRIYNQPVDINGKGLIYKNVPDCFIKIWRSEGFAGFYKGVSASYFRLMPHGILMLVLWELLKDFEN